MDVVIDGSRYTPADQVQPTLGIAVSTRNRYDVLAKTLEAIREHTPDDTVVVVVDDASDKPVEDADFRFSENAGIARVKNKSISLLMDAGVEHLILLDDDTRPIAADWWKPYVESPEPHLMHIFQHAGWPKPIYQTPDLAAYTAPRGCLLYLHRSVIETVGGMRTDLGKYGGEHVEYSRRIHAAGLTTFTWQDVPDSHELVYCLDSDGKVKSTVPQAKRGDLGTQQVYALHGDTSYQDYREKHGVILTCYFTGQVDPQRGKQFKADKGAIKALADSVKGNRLVVLNDCWDDSMDDHVEYVRVPTGGVCAYQERWVQQLAWLKARPEVTHCWVVDATDVTLLRDPWSIQDGVLYCGSELESVGCEWMRNQHQQPRVQQLIEDHADEQLLNCGVVGGDRATMLRLLHRVVAEQFYVQDDPFRQHPHDPQAVDMGPFNVATQGFQVQTGETVTTRFKAQEKEHALARWRHK